MKTTKRKSQIFPITKLLVGTVVHIANFFYFFRFQFGILIKWRKKISPDCPVERLPVLPIHTGLFAQLSNAQVRKLSILNNLNDNHNWFKKVKNHSYEGSEWRRDGQIRLQWNQRGQIFTQSWNFHSVSNLFCSRGAKLISIVAQIKRIKITTS